MIFQFKQFGVEQSGCAMKINTDGVLLGALVKSDDPQTVLDIGTGTGVIALMLAQKFPEAMVDAVEIDLIAATTARKNFYDSPFSGRLSIFPIEIESYFESFPDKKYDLIVSNPPFYINSLVPAGYQKNLAKHTNKHFFNELIGSIAKQLTAKGTCWLILPLKTSGLVKMLASQNGLQVYHTITIHSFTAEEPHREIIVIGHSQVKQADERFVIYEAPKVYSKQYQEALKEFFIIF